MTLVEKIRQTTQAERGGVPNLAEITVSGLGRLLPGGGSAPANNSPAGWVDMTDRFQKAAAASRLGLPLLYGSDAVHGHNNLMGAVLYPHNFELGTIRDPGLMAARLPGSERSAGVANALFGKVGFADCLPVTWPRNNDQLPVGRPKDAGALLFAH